MNRTFTLIIAICAIGLLIFTFVFKPDKPLRKLAYFGKRETNATSDTVYHTIADFKFTDQTGKEVTQADFRGKIYVADYFFATCQSICPLMSGQMERVVEKFGNNNDVKFISHTVDPENDSVSVLAAYAQLHHANPAKWHFVTGDKKHLYDLARNSYFLSAEPGDGGPDDFIHAREFVLIDKEKHMRGIYDGTDSVEVNRLIGDIQILLAEYNSK